MSRRALESQRTKGTAEEEIRLYYSGYMMCYSPAEEEIRLRPYFHPSAS
jgi:hypothetical protein